MLTPAGMTALETASGVPFGEEKGAFRLPPGSHPAPSAALEQALLPALRRPPCVVSFSGGRDSSLVLAAAVAAAAREGLPAPLPVTLCFPGAERTRESHWQEHVVAHLGVEDWIRVELSDELDFVGPVARPLLLELGPLYPPNAHLVEPILDRAAGGSLVSGLGGDEVFGLWRRRHLADVAAGRSRPSWRDAARVAGVLAPEGVRRAALRRRYDSWRVPWLREGAQAEVDAAVLQEQVSAPARWDRHLAAVGQYRSVLFAVRDIGRITTSRDCDLHVPLIDPGFAAALAHTGGWRGFGSRAQALKTLFGHWLPDAVLGRRDKAVFNEVFFSEETRRFARDWSGEGIDTAIIDPEPLRREWLEPPGDYRSAMLLQSAWLHQHGNGTC